MPQGRLPGLVERDRELVEIDEAVDAAVAGEGVCLLFVGPAGIGKTALLGQGRKRAGRAGAAFLAARGGELEGEFPYGVARQWLEPTLRAAPAARRRRLLAGAAAFGRPAVLGPVSDAADPADQGFAVLHGLYWLIANLAREAPLVLMVDDAHWADAPSLRFLVYLVRRLEGLTVSVVASVRTGEAGSDPGLVDELERSPGVRVARPRALSEGGVARLLEARFGCAPGHGFARACWEATAGNPLFVRELAAALIADGIEPTGEAAGAVATAAPDTIAHATLARLGRLSPDTVELARAVAVLGLDATLPRAGALAGLDEPRALAALDALAAADVVRADSDSALVFRHPIVRAAIYDEFAAGARSGMHARAAALLSAQGADLDAVAGQLLRTTPTGAADTIAILRDAARHSLGVGAPEAAATYLGRALEESPERQLRADLLLELAGAEQLARRPSAIDHYEQARALSEDPIIRARAMIELAWILAYMAADVMRAIALVDQALAELADRDQVTTLAAEILRGVLASAHPRFAAGFAERIPVLRELIAGGGVGTRPLRLLLAASEAQLFEPAEHVRAQVELGWNDGAYLADGDSLELLAYGLGAAIHIDELELAEQLVAAIAASSRASGSVLKHLLAGAYQAWIETQRGNLAAAAGDSRAMIERAVELELWFPVATALGYCCEALVERPDLADLAALADSLPLGPMAEMHAGAVVAATRGRLRFVAGDRAGAIVDLRRAGAVGDALGLAFPVGLDCWRSSLALMLAPDEPAEAHALASAELADASRRGQPRQIGIALRALGLLAADRGEAIGQLEQAVTVLAASPARLEHARALVELGAARRRHGFRAAARAPLHDGLDLAVRCGATRLIERARIELGATGARPRRDRITGRDALTPSELRVTRMAGEGMPSRQIAETLFVTTNTVDTHLARAYQKLGIHSRKQLRDVLDGVDRKKITIDP